MHHGGAGEALRRREYTTKSNPLWAAGRNSELGVSKRSTRSKVLIAGAPPLGIECHLSL